MFKRLLLNDLIAWKNSPNRKPLVLRGARQVGKTTLVKQFSSEFGRFISLNLEKQAHRDVFETLSDIRQIVAAIFYTANQPHDKKSTLIFIDEIQNSPKAIASLRYFYEEYPDLYVIAAGSLLETLLTDKISFPVGRVEFLPIRPCSFVDFLSANGDTQSLELLSDTPPPDFAHEKLSQLFRQFTLVGGMPEAIAEYAQNYDLVRVNKILSGLITTYIDDVEKYSKSDSATNYIRHILKTGFAFSGQRIKFEGFGESNYKSREMGEAFKTLEKTFLLELIYPTTNYTIPLIPDLKKSPRLQWLDVGLTNYLAGVQNDVFFSKQIDEVWKGTVAELIVGQELIAAEKDIQTKRSFWVRQAKSSNAELDFVLNTNGLIIPVEVKLSAGSHLRSLHLFMEHAPHDLAVRIWSKKFELSEMILPNQKKVRLLNVPFYMSYFLKEIVKKYL